MDGGSRRTRGEYVSDYTLKCVPSAVYSDTERNTRSQFAEIIRPSESRWKTTTTGGDKRVWKVAALTVDGGAKSTMSPRACYIL